MKYTLREKDTESARETEIYSKQPERQIDEVKEKKERNRKREIGGERKRKLDGAKERFCGMTKEISTMLNYTTFNRVKLHQI